MLMDIADAATDSSLDLHILIFGTCLCNTSSLPPIPNSTVTATRPDIHKLLARILSSSLVEDEVEDKSNAGVKQVFFQGGVGVCASGPESLTREAANAVARLAPVHGTRVGGIALHTEVFLL